jgi:hypothetical protein
VTAALLVEARTTREPIVDALARFTALHAAWLAASWSIERPLWTTLVAAIVALAAGVLAFRRPDGAHLMAALASLVVAAALRFPDVPNHAVAVALVLAVVAFVRREQAREHLAMVAVLILAWAGVQKLLAGTWTNGAMLAYEVAHEPRFAVALGPLVSEAERAAWVRAGVYAPSWPLVAIASFVWVGELVLAFAIALPRSRRGGAWVGLVGFVLLVPIARELTFGMIMIALFAALALDRAPRGWLALAALGWALALAARIGPLVGALR